MGWALAIPMVHGWVVGTGYTPVVPLRLHVHAWDRYTANVRHSGTLPQLTYWVGNGVHMGQNGVHMGQNGVHMAQIDQI